MKTTAAAFLTMLGIALWGLLEGCAEAPRRADPWGAAAAPAAEDGAVGRAQSPVVVGPNNLTGLWCSGVGAGPRFNSLHTPRYVTDGGAACTALFVTLDNRLLVHPACVAAPGEPLGEAQFAYEQDPCGGTTFSDELARFGAVSQEVDPVTGFGLVQLAGNPAATFPTAKLGAVFGVEALPSDPTFVLTHQAGSGPAFGVLADVSSSCRITSAWSNSPAGRVASTSCDVLDPAGAGAPLYANFGAAAPLQAGRVYAVDLGPNGAGQNLVLSFRAFTCPTCLLGPHLTPGNFVP